MSRICAFLLVLDNGAAPAWASRLFGAIAIALFAEAMSIAMTFSALQHAASYNSWMAM